MKKLHEFIRRLSRDVTTSIDDISRKISLEYMRKKTNDLRRKRETLSAAPTITSKPESQSERKLGTSNDDFLNSDLFGEQSLLHDFGRIHEDERNFESLNRKGKSSLEINRSHA